MLGILKYCADALAEVMAEFAYMAKTQLDAQLPPGPVAGVEQADKGEDFGTVRLPRFPDMSTVI